VFPVPRPADRAGKIERLGGRPARFTALYQLGTKAKCLLFPFCPKPTEEESGRRPIGPGAARLSSTPVRPLSTRLGQPGGHRLVLPKRARSRMHERLAVTDTRPFHSIPTGSAELIAAATRNATVPLGLEPTAGPIAPGFLPAPIWVTLRLTAAVGRPPGSAVPAGHLNAAYRPADRSPSGDRRVRPLCNDVPGHAPRSDVPGSADLGHHAPCGCPPRCGLRSFRMPGAVSTGAGRPESTTARLDEPITLRSPDARMTPRHRPIGESPSTNETLPSATLPLGLVRNCRPW